MSKKIVKGKITAINAANETLDFEYNFSDIKYNCSLRDGEYSLEFLISSYKDKEKNKFFELANKYKVFNPIRILYYYYLFDEATGETEEMLLIDSDFIKTIKEQEFNFRFFTGPTMIKLDSEFENDLYYSSLFKYEFRFRG